MLAIGAALLGSRAVLGVDVDADALEVAQRNCEQYEEPLPVSVSTLLFGPHPRTPLLTHLRALN